MVKATRIVYKNLNETVSEIEVGPFEGRKSQKWSAERAICERALSGFWGTRFNLITRLPTNQSVKSEISFPSLHPTFPLVGHL